MFTYLISQLFIFLLILGFFFLWCIYEVLNSPKKDRPKLSEEEIKQRQKEKELSVMIDDVMSRISGK